MRAAVFAIALVGLVAARPASAEVQLTIADGQVTLSAKNATIAQILAEWSRVGQTRIVNGERIASTPLTMELTHVTEAQALDIILRSVSGYVLAPRSADATAVNGSRFDRIYILPTAAAPRPAQPAPPPAAAAFPQNRFQPPPPPDDQVEDQVAQRPQAVPPPQMQVPPPDPGVRPPQPGFITFPAPQQQAPAVNTGAPAGVPTPGMVVPAPPAPANRDIRSTQNPPQ